jgi:sigma-B regulation protein RsbU (phosphoserine phosphatase)
MFEEIVLMPADNAYDMLDNTQSRSREEQLSLLAEMVQSFAASLDINETLTNAIEKFIEYLDAEAASIFLLENENKELVCRGCVGPVDITGLHLPPTAGIVGKTVVSRSSQMVRDVSKDPDFDQKVDEKTGFITRSILCAPLIVKNECIGALELINKRGGDGLFDNRDRNFLVALASAAALAIHNARMADELVEQERLRKELELAREIQMSLLPAVPEDDFPVQGINVPALEVSGDFYDFFQREDGLIYFNLADVSGKGMNAALLMAKVSSLLHHLAKSVSDPGELLARVNAEVCETASHGMFVTLVSGFIDLKEKTIKLANAGHQPPLYYKSAGSHRHEEIAATAPPLGIMAGTEFPVRTLALDTGSLYLFTDGVTESMDEFNHPLDVEGLIRLIEASSQVAARKRLEGIVAEIRRASASQHDDITMMVIECRSP